MMRVMARTADQRINAPLVSVIIPVLNDTAALADLLPTLPTSPEVEIIVVNGGAADTALASLATQYRHVSLLSSAAGRGRQMNAGALSARGRWFLFLHADTRLPPDFLNELQRADRNPAIAGGSFRFQLDSEAWQARAIERAVRWRVRWLGLAYGDQGLFVRHDAFHRLGGYREWPLMEDVDLIRRLRRVGRLHHSPLPATTSARRWQHDGWWLRSVRNVVCQLLFFAGMSPARVAPWYVRHADANRRRDALIVMARAPSDSRGKSRLMRDISSHHLELRRALLLDTLDAVARVQSADLFVAFEPAAAESEFQTLVGGIAQLVPQHGGTIGDRMRHVLPGLFARGYTSVVIVGSDLPTLPDAYVNAAFERLRDGRTDVVIGPATDGGYYLIGLRSVSSRLFDAIPWSTPMVLARTMEIAETLRLTVSLTPQWYDVDSVEDLRRVIADQPAAARTQAWLAAHPEVVRQPNVQG
jgi:rSAM/selenodomain-associated transferase 2/rSAM/selenodomain-associated transferase 1